MAPNESIQQFNIIDESPISISRILFMIENINTVGGFTIFSLFGISTNIINMVVFTRIGFKDSINISLFGLALADLGTSILTLLLSLGLNPWFVQLDLLPFVRVPVVYLVIGYPRYVVTKVTTIITAFIAFERCVCVALPLKVRSIFTTPRVKIFIVLTYFVVIGSSAIIYIYQHLGWVPNPPYNKSIVGVVFTDNTIEKIFHPTLNSFFSFFPFISISICTAILVKTLKSKATWRQTATATKTTNDEGSTKEKKISKMVVLVSSLFIVCYSPTVGLALLMAADPGISIIGAKAHIIKTYSSFAYVLESVNSSMNLFIYYYNSSIYQSTFKKVFGVKGENSKNKA